LKWPYLVPRWAPADRPATVDFSTRPLEGGSKNSERSEEFFGAGCCFTNTPPRNSLFAGAQRQFRPALKGRVEK
jgi:hypothetical protein